MPKFSIEVRTCPQTQSGKRKDATQSQLRHRNGIHLEWVLAGAYMEHSRAHQPITHSAFEPKDRAAANDMGPSPDMPQTICPSNWYHPLRLRNRRQTRNRRLDSMRFHFPKNPKKRNPAAAHKCQLPRATQHCQQSLPVGQTRGGRGGGEGGRECARAHAEEGGETDTL